MPKVTSLPEAFAEIVKMDTTLRQRLGAYAEKVRELNLPIAEAYDRLVERLQNAGVGTGAPEVGTTMPSFLLPDQNGKLVNLEQLLRNGPVVLSFNRGHWCPFCKLELRGLAEVQPKLSEHNAHVVSIMPERQQYTSRLAQDLDDKLNILSDIDNGYALSLGLLMWVGDEVAGLMRNRGIDLREFQGNDGRLLPVPATFVLDHDGRIIARWVNPDFRTRMETDEILRALKLK